MEYFSNTYKSRKINTSPKDLAIKFIDNCNNIGFIRRYLDP